MDRELMIQAVEAAMDNKRDMDTPWSTYAAAAVDALGWRSIADDPPDAGDLIILTDGDARWMTTAHVRSDYFMRWQDTKPHVGTHWHPVHELPKKN